MEPGAVGVRLASSAVAPLVKRLFRAEGPGAGLVDRPVRMAALVSFRGEKRELGEDELRGLAEALVRRALKDGRRAAEPWFDGDEEQAVVEALTDALYALGDLDLDDVQAVQLGHEALARRLREAGGERAGRGLSADAAYALDTLLETACLHILHFFTQRSTFVARTLVEQSRRQAELVAKADTLIARTPLPDAQDAAFERDYLGYVARRHGKLTIYGVDLAHSTAKWPLDAAYMRLEATAPDWSSEWLGVLEPDEPPEPAGPLTLPADQALAEHDRVLLRGAAGSGKTTLVQWLAVSTARTEPGEQMAYLDGLVPFVLPLRTLTRHGERLPAPPDFLAATDCPLAGGQPGGWERRVLTAGRGLLLVDGVDEVPKAERDRVRRWLTDLIDAYPGNRWLATSRPSAVDEDWLAGEGFAELTLAPMHPADVAGFIRRWHAAARTDREDDARLPEYETQLLAAVRTKPDLGRLATNPLMCGLMCALNRDRRGYLPRGRKELYEAALSMLLARRDRERDMGGPDLREEPQLQVLQRLAYWLIRNGRTEMDRERAESIVAAALPAVPEVAALGDAKAVLEHFRDRSGLLREPGPDAVDFVHRTFQDFLGARAAVEEGDFGLLAANAADDQWEDVIRLAVAQARPREREEILKGLLAADSAEADSSLMRVRLLAVACLEHATELAPAVRRAVEWHAQRLVPPRTRAHARALGAAGPIVLDLLPGPEEVDDEDTARDVVTAATYVDSERAIPFLARYASHPSLDVRRQLAWAWHRYDTAQYAEEVIARLDPDRLFFTVTSDAELRALRAVGPRPMLEVRGPVSEPELAAHAAATPLAELILRGAHTLFDLGFLAGQSGLGYLRLSNCENLRDASALHGLPLRTLVLDEVPSLEGIPGLLAALPWLQHLSLSPDRETALDLAELPVLPELQTLNLLTAHTTGLRDLAKHPELAYLYLGWRHRPAGDEDWAALAALPRLEGLRATPALLAAAPDGFVMPRLQFLGLIDNRPLDDAVLARLPSLFPGVDHLVLDVPPRPGLELSPLTRLGSLWRLSLHEDQPPPAGLPSHVEVDGLAP